jgi:hypothetical protein
VSRKWERLVEKNKKNVNKLRDKAGTERVSLASKPDMDIFRGRSLFLPLLLISVSVLFISFFGQTAEKDALYWITVISYFLLGLYFFFLKRPFLKVGKAQLSTRKFGREKFVPAGEVEMIKVQSGYIIISFKNKRSHWVFSGVFNRFNLPAMAARLKEFANQHTIPYVVEN